MSSINGALYLAATPFQVSQRPNGWDDSDSPLSDKRRLPAGEDVSKSLWRESLYENTRLDGQSNDSDHQPAKLSYKVRQV